MWPGARAVERSRIGRALAERRIGNWEKTQIHIIRGTAAYYFMVGIGASVGTRMFTFFARTASKPGRITYLSK